jgi:hypothetical protein
VSTGAAPPVGEATGDKASIPNKVEVFKQESGQWLVMTEETLPGLDASH